MNPQLNTQKEGLLGGGRFGRVVSPLASSLLSLPLGRQDVSSCSPPRPFHHAVSALEPAAQGPNCKPKSNKPFLLSTVGAGYCVLATMTKTHISHNSDFGEILLGKTRNKHL